MNPGVGSLSVDDILRIIPGSECLESSGCDRKLNRVWALRNSVEFDVAFFISRKNWEDLVASNPTCLVTTPSLAKAIAAELPEYGKSRVIVTCHDPYLAMALVSQRFYQRPESVLPRGFQSSIDPSACLGENVLVSDGAWVGPGAKIGAGTVLYPGVVVGAGVEVGQNCVLFAHVVLYEGSRIGNRVRLHANVVIGADGFGYALEKKNGVPVAQRKIEHFGKVIIHDDVEIGPGSCVDRGTFDDTVIGPMVKIDNHVQVGHNCKIGEGSILCGKVGIAGSVVMGKYVYAGGAVGIANGVTIGDYAQLAAGSGIFQDVPSGTKVMGAPHRPAREFLRLHAMLTKMLEESVH